MTSASKNTGSASGNRLKAYTLHQFDIFHSALGRRREDLPEGIHAARKAIRFIRAALDLGRTSLGPDAAAIFEELKVLCRDLAPMRDACVVVGTVSGLIKKARRDKARHLLPGIRSRLVERQTLLLDRLLAQDAGLRHLRVQSRDLRRRTSSLPWSTVRDRKIQSALARSEHRTKRAARRARASPQGPKRHRWRRRLRRMRYQMIIVESALEWRIGKHASANKDDSHSQHERSLKWPITVARLEKLTSKLGFECDLRALRLAIRSDTGIDDHDRRQALKSARHELRAAIERLDP